MGASAALVPPKPLVLGSFHPERDVRLRRMLAVADLGGLAVGLAVMALLTGAGSGVAATGLLVAPLWIVLFKAYELYSRDMKRIGHTTVDDLPALFHALVLGSVTLWALYQLLPGVEVSFARVLTAVVAAGVATIGFRDAARRLSVRLLGPERVLLIGDGREIGVLAGKMRAHPEYEVEPVGILSSAGAPPDCERLPVLGCLHADPLDEILRDHDIERVVVAHSDVGEVTLMDVLRRCRELRVKVSVLPELFDVLGPSVAVDDVEGITMLGVVPPVFPRSSRLMKRTMDVVGASLILLFGLPFLALIALAIKLDSRGPVLFRQQRIGRGGRPFAVLKFRTMCVDAEARHEELRAASTDPGWLLIEDDPRITRVGRRLRHWSLDELPQVVNVLRGEMSLVGPRPLIESEDRQIAGWRRSRVDLTPGLTGLWQVLGRTRIPFEEMLKLDYLYVTNWSLWSDVRLILRTLPALLTRRGAN